MTHTIIVGGTRGIGKALASTLAAEGQSVSVLGRREVPVKDPGNLSRWSLDLTDAGARQRALDEILARHGGWNAIVFLQRFRDSGDDLQGNLEISLEVTRKILDYLLEKSNHASDRAVVLVTSHASHLVAGEQSLGYHVAKAALVQMARYLAVTLGSRGIRVNCVTPGVVLKEEAREFYAGQPDLVRLLGKITPLGRMGTSEDVVEAIRFLIGPGSRFVTGHDLVVDGGVSLHWQESLARSLTDFAAIPITREASRMNE